MTADDCLGRNCFSNSNHSATALSGYHCFRIKFDNWKCNMGGKKNLPELLRSGPQCVLTASYGPGLSVFVQFR